MSLLYIFVSLTNLQALFVGRAVVDEVLPPAFLVSVLKALPDGSLGVSVVQAAGGTLWCYEPCGEPPPPLACLSSHLQANGALPRASFEAEADTHAG